MNGIPECVMEEFRRVPFRWVHKHFDDESGNDWDRDAIQHCDVCKSRMKLAVENGEACEKHPLAYYEPATKTKKEYCEACEA